MFDNKLIENPYKIFRYDDEETFKKVYALEKILEHLHEGSQDPRKREKMRCQVALRTIGKWMDTGGELWKNKHH